MEIGASIFCRVYSLSGLIDSEVGGNKQDASKILVVVITASRVLLGFLTLPAVARTPNQQNLPRAKFEFHKKILQTMNLFKFLLSIFSIRLAYTFTLRLLQLTLLPIAVTYCYTNTHTTKSTSS